MMPRRKYFTMVTGTTPQCHEIILRKLREQRPELQEVNTVGQCDVILVFCSAVSQTGSDIDAALKLLDSQSDSKPAVLVVLHHTFDLDCTVPDSSRSVTRENTTIVDCLFHEDQGLLQCERNIESLSKVVDWLGPKDMSSDSNSVKIFTMITGNIIGCYNDFMEKLQNQISGLVVESVENCDVVVTFYPQTLNEEPWNMFNLSKPTIQVVVNLSADPNYTVPDRSRSVTRRNTITLDCLFREDQRLLDCEKNKEALSRAAKWIEDQESSGKKSEDSRVTRSPRPHQRVKYVSIISGKTLGAHEHFLQMLHEQTPDLQKVSTVEECDVILLFCPIVSSAGTDIEAALKLITEAVSKPAVLVVLHHTFDPDRTVPNSSRSVTRENTTTVDCLFHEDCGLLKCLKNEEALKKVVEKLKPQDHKKPPQLNTNRESERLFPKFSMPRMPSFDSFKKILQ
ncbi:uncharacterized protein LOC143518405 [Brachyhypopomus gauderio]|uniref:uncharacterized protein LOC143518405 n=1 Tax=Brachyhypopomus gauderio TaxID=698409 RepID=UPI00404291EA